MVDLKSKILVIDDMMSMRKLIMKCLRDLGYANLLEASDGAAGLELLTKSKPAVDLVLSDWNMPIMNGLELLLHLRASPTTQNIPLIMLTAESEVSMVKSALAQGASGYIVKPFTMQALKTHLDRVQLKSAG